jgi:hypothetical protein
MALQGVPWAIGGSGETDENGVPIGAHNTVEGARRALYDATGGARGVTNPTDMVVTELPVPGNAVRVHTGSCKSPNDYPGGGAQSYSGWEMSSTDVPVTTTGSSGTRINFLVWRVDDPQYAGQAPADVVNGPYNRYVWLPNNPYTSPPAFPHVPLVRLEQPASTSTITNKMLTDIREVANPRREEHVFGRPRVLADSSAGSTLTVRHAAGGEYFPGGDGSPNQFRVPVPSWCNYWGEFGDEYRDRTWPGNRQWEFGTQIFAFNSPDSGDASRDNWPLMDGLVMPAKLRGKTVTFAFKASLSAGSDLGVSMDQLGGLGMRLTFAQTAIRGDEAF